MRVVTAQRVQRWAAAQWAAVRLPGRTMSVHEDEDVYEDEDVHEEGGRARVRGGEGRGGARHWRSAARCYFVSRWIFTFIFGGFFGLSP